MTTSRGFDRGDRLIVTIQREQPISLPDLTKGMDALSTLYERYTGNQKGVLYVNKVRQGSIEIEMVNAVVATLPLLSEGSSVLVEFCYRLINIVKILQGQEVDAAQPRSEQEDFKDMSKFIGIANSPNASVGGMVKNNQGTIYQNCTFNIVGKEVPTMQRRCQQIISPKESTHQHSKQLFKWVQTHFSKFKTGNKGVIDKGVIENIYNKPLHIIFDNSDTKQQMTTSTDKTMDWQNKLYLVDVEVQYADNQPKAYKILRHYPEETFHKRDLLTD